MRLVVQEYMSLDGVVQAPMYPEEDTSGGFTSGGWNMPYMDEDAMRWTVEGVQSADAFLFGRGTFTAFARHWATAPAGQAPAALAEPFNSRPKFVASRTLREPLPWSRSQLLKGEMVLAVSKTKGDGKGTMLCIGSPGLVRNLLAADLVDGLRLMIDPVLVGPGKTAFPSHTTVRRFRLQASQTTGRGAILATYGRFDKPDDQRP